MKKSKSKENKSRQDWTSSNKKMLTKPNYNLSNNNWQESNKEKDKNKHKTFKLKMPICQLISENMLFVPILWDKIGKLKKVKDNF